MNIGVNACRVNNVRDAEEQYKLKEDAYLFVVINIMSRYEPFY